MKRAAFLNVILITTALTLPMAALANVGSVTHSKVNKGELSATLRTSYSLDDESESQDNRFRTRSMLDYGFTDSFALRLQLQTDNPGNDSLQYDATLIDARFELTDAAKDGFYSGFRLRHVIKDGDKKPDYSHIRLIAGVPIDKWDLRVNQIFAYEVGEERKGGIGVDTRFQATYQYSKYHRAGLESFSNFGYGSRNTTFSEQSHVIGPIFSGKFSDEFSYEAGYQYGVSRSAPDNTFKLFVTRYF